MKALNLIRFCICTLLVFVLGIYVLVLPELSEDLSDPQLLIAGGKGTASEPFIIETAEQFASFRDSVNKGTRYDDCYFTQTEDIDLERYSPWVPIGEYGTGFYFAGYYDGGGHSISNLICNGNDGSVFSPNVGLFGQLGGTVANLGIASGKIEGDHVGSIASHSVNNSAFIFNCYSLADINATNRGGGIVDNFTGGYVVNSWYAGENTSTLPAGISSYNTMGIYNCMSVIPLVASSHSGFVLNSKQLSIEYMKSPNFAYDLNNSIAGSEAFFKQDPATLTIWSFYDGKITYEG